MHINMQTNKRTNEQNQFNSFHLKIERIQHTNVTISLHHFNCLFMIFTYFICLLDVLWFIFVCSFVYSLEWDCWTCGTDRNGTKWHGTAWYNKQILTLTIRNAHIRWNTIHIYIPLNANINQINWIFGIHLRIVPQLKCFEIATQCSLSTSRLRKY